jgi:Secretion system C-terminal sorting domain
MLTAFDGEHTYSIVIAVGKCGMDGAGSFTLYPNPSTGTFTLSYTGDRTGVSSINIFNSAGEQVYGSIGFQSIVDLSNKPSGDYFVQIHLPSKIINLEVAVVK